MARRPANRPTTSADPAADDDTDGGAGGPEPTGDANGETMWRERAIERSTRAARQRAAMRVQQFLDSARAIIGEKESTEFTVQEVVDRSKQSLRSFYQYFDGKHELLLALFEEEIATAVARMRAVSQDGDPLDRLERAAILNYELSAPGRTSVQPLFTDFAQRLLVDHPEEVADAYAPVVDYFTALVEDAAAAGLLREGKPRRLAMIVLQTVSVTAGRSQAGKYALTGEEIWQFCLHAIAPDEVVAARRRA
jgi:AcrR family transcriptional regulator